MEQFYTSVEESIKRFLFKAYVSLITNPVFELPRAMPAISDGRGLVFPWEDRVYRLNFAYGDDRTELKAENIILLEGESLRSSLADIEQRIINEYNSDVKIAYRTKEHSYEILKTLANTK